MQHSRLARYTCSIALLIGSMAMQVSAGAQNRASREPNEANARAVREFLAVLDNRQLAIVSFPFDSNERTNWNFVPMSREGIPLASLNEQQRARIDPMLRSALSEQGVATAKRIVDHESILGPLERDRGVLNWRRRDPGLYYTTVFGDPAPNSTWAWRFEGHHLSVNVTQIAGESQIVAPVFMGANPARVPSGPHAGLRILGDEEDIARTLVRMLPAERRARALISSKALGDIVSGNDPKVQGLAFEGLAAEQMSPSEQERLRELVDVYAERLTPAAAEEQLGRIERAGFDRLHFAWAGSIEPGEPHYYRVHGPTVLIEYDNTQNDANHVHTVWRDLERDFGGDLLRKHLAHHHR
jgi:hypothetical protein